MASISLCNCSSKIAVLPTVVALTHQLGPQIKQTIQLESKVITVKQNPLEHVSRVSHYANLFTNLTLCCAIHAAALKSGGFLKLIGFTAAPFP